MKPDADVHSATFRHEYAHAATCFACKRELSRVFDRNGFIEVKKAAVHVNERMDLRAVCKIELQAKWRETGAVCSLTLKGRDAARTGGPVNDHTSRHRNGNSIECVLQCKGVIRGERAAITKCSDKELAIASLIFV